MGAFIFAENNRWGPFLVLSFVADGLYTHLSRGLGIQEPGYGCSSTRSFIFHSLTYTQGLSEPDKTLTL